MIDYIKYNNYEELKEKALSQIDLNDFFMAYEGENFMVFISTTTTYKEELLEYYKPIRNYLTKSGLLTFKTKVSEIVEKYDVDQNDFSKAIKFDSFLVGYLDYAFNYCKVCGEINLKTSKTNPFGYFSRTEQVCDNCTDIVREEENRIFLEEKEEEYNEICNEIGYYFAIRFPEDRYEEHLNSFNYDEIIVLKKCCSLLKNNKNIYDEFNFKFTNKGFIYYRKPKYYNSLTELLEEFYERNEDVKGSFYGNWNYLITNTLTEKVMSLIPNGIGLRNIFYNDKHFDLYENLLIEYSRYNVFPQVPLMSFMDTNFISEKVTNFEYNYFKLARVNFLITTPTGMPIKVIELIKLEYSEKDILKEKFFKLAQIEFTRVDPYK